MSGSSTSSPAEVDRPARLLVVTAAAAELAAALGGFGQGAPLRVGPYDARRVSTAAGAVTGIAGGVGPAAAASATATALALERADAVLVLGIGGGFRARADRGYAVVATAIVAADLGAESPDGFLGLAELGWAAPEVAVPAAAVEVLRDRIAAAGVPVVTGPILTLSSMTGTDERAEVLAGRYGAVAEAMEGGGAAEAAARHGVPTLELRAISNVVGRRDRAGWDIPGALAVLEAATAAALSAPLPLDTAPRKNVP